MNNDYGNKLVTKPHVPCHYTECVIILFLNLTVLTVL